MNLDEYQTLAAYHNFSYSVILAGAGTGKTYTLLGRISYLVHERGLKPEEIVVISYTNETVLEFQEKVKQILGFTVNVFTFHKFAMFLLDYQRVVYSLCEEDYLSYVIEEFLLGYVPYIPSLQKYLLQIIFPFYNYFWKDFFKIQESQEIKSLKKEITQFIHLYYAKGYSISWLRVLILNSFGKRKAFYFIVFCIILLYESELESQNMVDYDSLISLAIQSISNISQIPFRHILVDEFQDSSQARIELISKVVQKFHLSFTVVGDDCQSIYGFSGTEANCFRLLHQKFSSLQFFYLKYTYRNSQELIHMANHFVLKNKLQLKKDILSLIHIENPIEVLFYRKSNSIMAMLQYISFSPDQTVLFLGRNSFDWKYYFQEKDIVWKDTKHFVLNQFPGIVFSYLTVHQSKGLEADVVIILHMKDGTYGFPNKMKLPCYFSCFSSKHGIRFEEERRLFYVALTRTKGKVFLIVPLYHSSLFVKELLRDFKKQIKVLFF